MAVLLVPPLDTRLAKMLMDALLALRPADPVRFAIRLDAHHLLRHRQIRIDRRRKGVDQLRPRFVPQPKHAGAVAAEVALRRALFSRGLAPILSSYVFPGVLVSI